MSKVVDWVELVIKMHNTAQDSKLNAWNTILKYRHLENNTATGAVDILIPSSKKIWTPKCILIYSIEHKLYNSVTLSEYKYDAKFHNYTLFMLIWDWPKNQILILNLQYV